MSSVTAAQDLGAAVLDLLLRRHELIARNIAHASDPGFQPFAVALDGSLAQWRERLRQGIPAQRIAAAVRDRATGPAVRAPGPGRLDDQASALTANTLQYQALAVALQRLGALERIALTGE